MKRALLILISVFFSSCSFFSPSYNQEGFVKVRGTHFVCDGVPYYYAGTNMWYGCYIGSPGSTGDRPRLIRELDSMKADGICNVRLLAASEKSYIKRSIKPAIQIAPGVVDDSLLEGLDFVLAEMAKRDMKAVLFLNNYWEWSGGMAQYNVWATGEKGKDPEVDNWAEFMDFSSTFYTNEKAKELFLNYLKLLVSRRNTVDGRLYADDPTIMTWELANEPRPGRDDSLGRSNIPAYIAWIENTAEYIHSLDTNHLVCAGTEGTVGTLDSAGLFIASEKTPYIDYVTMHVWPLNWGWFDPLHFKETLQRSERNALAYIDKHFELARELNKPIVMEEFGLGRDSGKIEPGTPTTARDEYYKLIFRTLYDSARAGAPIAGSNFWAWGGGAHAYHEDGMWRIGDPFMGDPPQEPQGRNSIFFSDQSTLNIIRDHALKMSRLGKEDSLFVSSGM
jgi:mannan endo-1,4-beta-mannosidase